MDLLSKKAKKKAQPVDIVTVPKHVAIIMDGNGRWAERRLLPRNIGHREGVKAVRKTVEACHDYGVEVLTLFAFSSENWLRPPTEVKLLMELFLTTLRGETKRLHERNIRLRMIGEKSGFSEKLQFQINEAEALTANNTAMTLAVAANYGGRWDILQAARKLATQVRDENLAPADITLDHLQHHIGLNGLPEPDLFIRTGGERRISNFLLWQLAYTELYFTEQLWPDFNGDSLADAFSDFNQRQRRFGKTGKQVEQEANA